MKTFLLMTTAIATLAAGAASAADMPVYKGPVRSCAADQFGGGYIGLNAGGANWTANRTDQDEVLVDTASYVQKKWGGVVGGQVGYNVTTCNTVWGIELDGDWASTKATTQLIPNSPFFNVNIQSRFDALLTARTRAGIVVDNLLLYVTGGLAAGHFRTTYTNQFFGIPGVVPGTLSQADFNEWRWGLAAGFGVEWAWSPRREHPVRSALCGLRGPRTAGVVCRARDLRQFHAKRLNVGQPDRHQREVRRPLIARSCAPMMG